MEVKRMVEVRKMQTGETTTIPENVWKDWGSAKAKDNEVRHGYVLVRSFTQDGKGNVIAEDKPKGKTFAPNLQDTPKANGAAPAQRPSTPQNAAPALPKQPQEKPDNLIVIPALTMKVAEALTAAGFGTYKALSTADPDALGKVLDGMVPPMSPKKAQIPAWQKAAKELSEPKDAMV